MFDSREDLVTIHTSIYAMLMLKASIGRELKGNPISENGMDLMFEELKIGPGAGLDSVAIKDSGIRQSFDVIIIAIKKADGQMVFNPGPDVLLELEDVLITMGDKGQLRRLAAKICQPAT